MIVAGNPHHKEPLDVYLYGQHVAKITQRMMGKLYSQYTPESANRWGIGVPLLSCSMPLDPGERYVPSVATPFFNGVLPEGGIRRKIEKDFKIHSGDALELLRLLGRDCAGAMVIQSESSPSPPIRTPKSIRILSDSELAQAVKELKSHPMGISTNNRVRPSLAGMQAKLLLAQTNDGKWGLPEDGTPSTHILKPAPIDDHIYSVPNEALCLRIAKKMNLTDIDIDVWSVGDRSALVVSRYDRHTDDKGDIQRIHQEDACQALGIMVDTEGNGKYQYDSPNISLANVAKILADFSVKNEQDKLLGLATLNVALGNADAHGKNFSFLHLPNGDVRLAPAYDIQFTTYTKYYDADMGMSVNDIFDIHKIKASDLVAEATKWGMDEQHADNIVHGVLNALPEIIRLAADDTPDAPQNLVDILGLRVAALQNNYQADYYYADELSISANINNSLLEYLHQRTPCPGKVGYNGAPCILGAGHKMPHRSK